MDCVPASAAAKSILGALHEAEQKACLDSKLHACGFVPHAAIRYKHTPSQRRPDYCTRGDRSSMAQPPRKRARRARPPTNHKNLQPNARESTYAHNEALEEVLRRRALLRDAPTFLRRRLEDPISTSQLPIQFQDRRDVPAAITVVRRAPDRDERLVK